MKQPRTILIIEGNPQVQELWRHFLYQDSRYAYTVVATETGEQGVASYQTTHPDAVLLTYELPGMNGLDVLQTLQHDLGTSDLPVVLLAAEESGSLTEQARQYGAQHCLEKAGLTAETLQLALHSALKQGELLNIHARLQKTLIERQQVEAAFQHQTRQEQVRWTITQAIRQSLDLNAILNNAVATMRQTLQADRVAVYRFYPDWSGEFIAESASEEWVPLVGPDIHKIWEDTYLQETQGGRFRHHELFVVPDIYTAELQPCHLDLLHQFQARSYVIAPVFSGDSLWGLLAMYQNSSPRHWEPWEIKLLQQIASQLAIAIQQSRLYEQLQEELLERQQTTAVIREAERRWRSLLDHVHLLVVGLDTMGLVNYANPFFLNLTGYSESEVIGKNWCDRFVAQSDRLECQTLLLNRLGDNVHPYHQSRIVAKSGEERLIAWNNTVLQGSDGTAIGTISIGEDITERQKIEQMKSEFIGIVSHELRTPLTAIQMSLGLLKTGIYDQKPDKFRRMIEIALIDTNRLVNLVNDILDLERLQSGRAVLDKIICPAMDLMQQAVNGMRAIAAQQFITLTIIPTDLEVWAAPDAILQTLTNLLSNAIKFSPPHSTIWLRADQGSTPHPPYSSPPLHPCIRFSIQDQGRGIPADKLETIFSRFQQVDASDSREKGGTGLGLAICRSIVEEHGGQIWVESVLGEGSTFFFTLPPYSALEDHSF